MFISNRHDFFFFFYFPVLSSVKSIQMYVSLEYDISHEDFLVSVFYNGFPVSVLVL